MTSKPETTPRPAVVAIRQRALAHRQHFRAFHFNRFMRWILRQSPATQARLAAMPTSEANRERRGRRRHFGDGWMITRKGANG